MFDHQVTQYKVRLPALPQLRLSDDEGAGQSSRHKLTSCCSPNSPWHLLLLLKVKGKGRRCMQYHFVRKVSRHINLEIALERIPLEPFVGCTAQICQNVPRWLQSAHGCQILVCCPQCLLSVPRD